MKPSPPGAAGYPSRSADGATGMGPDGRRFPDAVVAAWRWPPSPLALLPFERRLRGFPASDHPVRTGVEFGPPRRATAFVSFSACSDPLLPGSVTRQAGASRFPAGAPLPVVSGHHPARPLSRIGPCSRTPPRCPGSSPGRWRILRAAALSRRGVALPPKRCRRPGRPLQVALPRRVNQLVGAGTSLHPTDRFDR
jgi:hypothetical protein